MANKNWIAKATENKGVFSAKAKKAGKTTSEYASQVTKKGSKVSTKTKREANLAKTLNKMRSKKKGK